MAGIEELKSKLISKGGMAMSNQFLVEFTLRYSGEGKAVKGMDARTLNVLCKEVNLFRQTGYVFGSHGWIVPRKNR